MCANVHIQEQLIKAIAPLPLQTKVPLRVGWVAAPAIRRVTALVSARVRQQQEIDAMPMTLVFDYVSMSHRVGDNLEGGPPPPEAPPSCAKRAASD